MIFAKTLLFNNNIYTKNLRYKCTEQLQKRNRSNVLNDVKVLAGKFGILVTGYKVGISTML